jgi:hypothetical protein
MAQTRNAVSPKEIIKNIDNYEFRCDIIELHASLEVRLKAGGLIGTFPMQTILMSGTMNSTYAKAFFADVLNEAKQGFIKRAGSMLDEKKPEEKMNGKT